jgi:ATP-dependent DNA helicase PIF1
MLRTDSPDSVAITASTGIAGLNIGGSTVHSFAGIGLGKESAQILARRIRKSIFPCQRWINTSTLIIDESKNQVLGMAVPKLTSPVIQYLC